MSDLPVLVLGANPAWQRIVTTAHVHLGDVVRVQRVAECPAGKGYNCAQAIFHLGGRPILIGGCGPGDGEWETACREGGVQTASFPLEGPIRTALTLVESSTGQTTELVEVGPAATPGADTLLDLLLGQRLPGAAVLVVCGSFPSGLSPETVLAAWTRDPIPLVVDSLPLARILTLPPEHPRVVLKLNLAEWQSLLGPLPAQELLALARERWPEAELVATLGREGCAALKPDGTWLRKQPMPFPADQTVHPIGAGDAFCAGLAKIVALGGNLEQALSEGLALARASCLHQLPARFQPGDLLRLREDLREPLLFA